MGIRRLRGYKVTCLTCAFLEADVLPKTWRSSEIGDFVPPCNFMVDWCVHCLGDPTTPTPPDYMWGRTRRSPSRS